MSDLYTISLLHGALVHVPVWESHARGKNWCAIIRPDPKAPGGLGRDFLERARGEYYYLDDLRLQPGVAVEFGADYYTGAGKKKASRWWGVVEERTEDALRLSVHASGAEACRRGEELLRVLATSAEGFHVTSYHVTVFSRREAPRPSTLNELARWVDQEDGASAVVKIVEREKVPETAFRERLEGADIPF